MSEIVQQCQSLIIPSSSEGNLFVWEVNRHIPFDIRRVYHIGGVPKGMVRGHHAHKTLEQILVCPYGIIEIQVDNGKQIGHYMLDSPGKGVYIGPLIWHTMRWVRGESLLLVMASQPYNEEDYIREYSTFKSIARN